MDCLILIWLISRLISGNRMSSDHFPRGCIASDKIERSRICFIGSLGKFKKSENFPAGSRRSECLGVSCRLLPLLLKPANCKDCGLKTLEILFFLFCMSQIFFHKASICHCKPGSCVYIQTYIPYIHELGFIMIPISIPETTLWITLQPLTDCFTFRCISRIYL